MNKLKLFAVVLTLLMSIAFPIKSQQLSNLKLATVNMQLALNNSVVGQQSKAKLEQVVKSKTAEFKAREEKIIKLRREIENGLLNASAKERKIKELETLQSSYLKDRQNADIDLKKMEQEYTADVFKDLKDVIESYAKKNKYDLVIEYSLFTALLYNNLKIADITDEVIQAYNDRVTSTKK